MVPSDSVFKGYEEVVIQDLIVRTDTVLFRKEKLYSPSTGRTDLAPLPPGYEGQFGPELKALAVSLAFGSNVSEAKIREFFGQAGILISAGGLSNLLIHGQDRFHEEKGALFEAGLRSTPWHHLDETSTAVKGVNHSCHGVCNPLYTAYFTLASKGRLSVLEALRGGRKPLFILNVEALKILEESRLPKRLIGGLACLPREERLTEEDLGERLSKANLPMGPQQKAQILAALALAAYHTEAGRPRLLAGDDAPQFKGVADALALCWIHEGRPNKKLQPALPLHQRRLQVRRSRTSLSGP